MKHPIFSVIIPAHNEENYIAQTIDSILAQTEQSFEIIVVLDNCTDKSLDIVFNKSTLDDRIKYTRVQKGSAAGARNEGLKLAKGKYVVFQDADCFADPTLLNNAAKYFEDYGVDGVATQTSNTPPKTWVQQAVAAQRAARWENNRMRPTLLTADSGINVAIMRRDVAKKLGGFNEKIFYFEDNDLTQRFFKAGYEAIFGVGVIQYHNDPLTLTESFGQCRSIAKGMRLRKKLTRAEIATMVGCILVPFNFVVMLAIILFAYYKTRDYWGAFFLGILWELRSLAKLWYYLFGGF